MDFKTKALLAGLAAVVTAVATHSEERKAINEQNNDVLRHRLDLDNEARNNQLNYERRRLEIENEARKDQLNLQRQMYEEEILKAKARKPIYRNIPNIYCPVCGFQREANFDTGFVICPCCNHTERMIIDHYEVDYEVYQRLKTEEEERRKKEAEELAVKQRHKTIATISWIIISILAMTAYVLFEQKKLLFAALSIIIIIVILAIAYPKLRTPAFWILFFPLPLTAMVYYSFSTKQRKILLITLSWVTYIGGIAFLYLYLKSHSVPTNVPT